MSDNKRSMRKLIPMTIRLFKMAKPMKKLLIISTISSIIGSLSHMGLMGFGAMLVLSSAGYAGGSPIMWGVLVLICSLSIALNRYLEGYTSHVGAYGLLCDMRVDMYETLRTLAPACLVDRKKGDIISVAVADIETIEIFFAHTIGPFFTVVLLPLVSLIIAYFVNPLFALTLLPIYLVISVVLPLVAIRAGQRIGMEYREALGSLKTVTLEGVYGLRDIQIFGAGDAELGKVVNETAQINRIARFMTLHRQIVTSAPTFFIYLARIAIAAVTIYLAYTGQGSSVGVIVLSFVVAASFTTTMTLTTIVSSLLETYAAAARVFEIEDMQPKVVESADAIDITSIDSIVFDNVSFAYTDDGKEVLKNVSFSLERGETLGVVGESGIGKSTIIRLLLRFWEVSDGEILINGTPLKDISLHSLRSKVAMLEQDTFIFDDTITANIALGKPEASKEDITKAAKQAGIHNFIETLPDGYETRMGELGDRISGGEKQRIGIARTLMMNPDVLVMDEPTSSLDVLSEKAFLKTLEEISKDKAVFIVSHRPSTLTGCSRIVEIKDGLVVERSIAS